MGRSRLEKFISENDDSDSGSDSSRSRSRSGSAKSGSPASRKSGSPASRKSGSASPARSGSGSPARSGSGSPARSGSRSPAKSGSASPAKSASPSGSRRSGSGSQARSRSRSKSKSKSPVESEQSATPARSKSKSGSPSRSRSRSKSGSQVRSKTGSPSRSQTRSPGPVKKDDSDSDVEAPKKRKHGSGSDSGSDIEGKKKPKAGSTTPKSEASDTEKVGAEDLFGDDLSVSSEDEADAKSKKAVIDDSDGDDVQRYDDDDGNDKKKGLDSDSDDEIQKAAKAAKGSKPYDDKPDEDQIPETRIDVEVPKINTDLGREIHFVKLPNFLSVESRPFDETTYEDEMDEDQNQQDEEGRTRLKLKVENTIRWRQAFDKAGNSVKESNARMVKWSDGSYSLHLGSEIFDVHKLPLQSDFNHLFIRQGTGLQGQAVFKTKLSFRPHSTDSQTHKKMTLSMADRSSKSNQIKVISQVGVDPEANRWERMKKEEQALRDAMRKDATKKRVREKGSSKGLSGGYLEDGDDSDNDAAFSIAAIKAKYKTGGAQPKKKPIYSSDDDSDLESKKGKRLEKAKGVDSDSDSARSARSAASSKSRASSSSRSRSGSPASKKSSGSDSD
eukprot:GFUD01121135.1.p1 GENE.GFUD01121135.1~~GFUD01121135.1.p1  ORF type:complete len:615 (-),score=221.68 GFUD01121135.1:41-1885(-)